MQVRLIATKVPFQPGAAQDGPGGAQRNCFRLRDDPNTLQPVAPDGLARHQDVVLLKPRRDHLEEEQHVVAPAFGQVGGNATGTDEVVVHPQAGDLLEETQDLLALAPAVDHHADRTKVHAVGRHEQQVAAHAVQFAEQHPHPDGALGNVAVDTQQLLGGHAEDEFVVQRAEVVHAGDVGAALYVRQVLALLLHAGVQVADDRLATQHGFALQLQHQAQHAVGAGVLRPHVDDHGLIVGRVQRNVAQLGGVGLAHAQHCADLAEEFARGQFAARLEALLGLVALADRLKDVLNGVVVK